MNKMSYTVDTDAKPVGTEAPEVGTDRPLTGFRGRNALRGALHRYMDLEVEDRAGRTPLVEDVEVAWASLKAAWAGCAEAEQVYQDVQAERAQRAQGGMERAAGA